MTERFYKDRGNLHFILMTSETSYFPEYEKRFYKEVKNHNNFFTSMTKVLKEINIKQIKNIKKNENIKKIKTNLKEYDNLKNLLQRFLSANFPYVSLVYDGFYAIHNKSLKYSIPLLNHKFESCSICMDLTKTEYSSDHSFFGKILNWSEGISNSFKNMTNTQAQNFPPSNDKSDKIENIAIKSSIENEKNVRN